MRKIFYILTSMIYCVSSHNSYAQCISDEEPIDGKYYQDFEIDKYVGTWKWSNATEEFSITLSKKKHSKETYWVDVLYGGYRYVKNGVEIVSTLNDIGGEFAPIQSSVREENEIKFFFTDKLKDKWGYVFVQITSVGNTYRMTWQLSNPPGIYAHAEGDSPFDPDFSVPENMVLTKQ